MSEVASNRQAVVANWNLGLDDAGAPPFGGVLRFAGGFCEAVEVDGTLAWGPMPGPCRAAPRIPGARQAIRGTGAQRQLTSPGMMGLLYVVGGHASGQTLDVFQRFDMVAGCWELLPGMTSPRHGCSACATNGVLYVLGGADDRAIPLQTFERFDPELGRWEKLPRMPTARHGAACCSVAGLVYALGGFDGQTVLSSAERFDAARRGWETLPPLPTGRGRCAAAGCEGLVLLGGGSDDTHEVAAFEEFNPSIWQWQVRPELPTARGGLAMAVPSGSSVVLAIGGRRTNGEKLDVVECYNLRRHRWSTLAPLSSPRDGCCACAFLSRVYVFGGRGMGTSGNQTLAHAECFDLETNTWSSLPQMPHATCGCAAAALVDAAAVCDDLVETTHRLGEAGALGVIFVHHEHGLPGLALGDAAPPKIRAVVIERDPGLEVVKLASTAAIFAELKLGKLISEDAYEEQFIFRVDEFLATRKENFLWHRYPSLLKSTGKETLSARLMSHLTMPEGWFSRPMAFVPLFNPSLLSLSDGTFLVALRMSNGQGCPSVRAARESSMDTRVCRNELVLAHLAKDFSVLSHVLVEMPRLSCYFTPETQTAGRQFLDEVHGPMDARIAWGADEIWVLFYAERNQQQEVERGMHAAPLHISWEKCRGWSMHSNDAVWTPSQCRWLGAGLPPYTLQNCQQSCEAKERCNAFSFHEDSACELRHCRAAPQAPLWHMKGWQSWRRGAPQCLQRAWVKDEELLAFPAGSVEKNWNLIEGQRDRLFLEYFIEPHIVLTAHLQRHAGR
ncbi:unnamed protein product [Cladocopium goreaui]|uniref:Kelch-like protein 5 n=1 Tax=Cladocopium goreaui TaxID=2562237 RepID=A0A9P1D167_9DINO|nr:unnamed protein product [Cladocopium goreaui]